MIQKLTEGVEADNRGYKGSKPSQQDWAYMLEEDPDFAEDFKRVFNNSHITEADNFTPDMFEDTYDDMEIALPRDVEGTVFAKVKNCLWYEKSIPIVSQHDNNMLYTRVYEVKYLYGNNASLSVNTIAQNLFSQVDEYGNRFMLFDDIVDHRVGGTEIMQ